MSAHRFKVSKVAMLAAIDSLIWLVAVPVGVAVRLEFELGAFTRGGVVAIAVVGAVSNVVVGQAVGLYRGRWRIGSIDEASRLGVLALLVTTLVSVVTVVAERPIPLGGVWVAGMVALSGFATTRVLWRNLTELTGSSTATKRLLVFGAGDAASQVVTSILVDEDRVFQPVALLDDDPSKARFSIRGRRVEGTRADIADVARRHDASVLLIAVPSADAETISEITALGTNAGLEVLVVPPAAELYGTLTVNDIRSVTEEDLLGRRPIETDLGQVADYIAGRTVLITGAGGSIGSELCRQVSELEPERLVMLDRDESALHAVQLSLDGKGMLDSEELVVANIRDTDRLLDVFGAWQPNVVFHAAALKHLPLLELHPDEGVKTNVVGTLNVLEAAATFDVDCFVNVSTDKAADPTSVLGYTKRIAERLTAHFDRERAGTFQSVRFGNVLGSRGSVLTAFRSQIDHGGPVTVTHEKVTRYFMTVKEAVQLVIQAGALGSDGDVLVLDMGEPVGIMGVARRMIDASDADVGIEITGLRRGEKLHEVLLGRDEPDVRPEHPLISHASVPPLDPLELHRLLDGHTRDLDVMVDLCANGARRWSPELWAEDDDECVIDIRTSAPRVHPPVRIRLAEPSLGEAELAAVRTVFESGVLTNGPRTAEFEAAFAARHDVEHAVAVATGTIALQAMFTALDIGPGDEVIVPSLTFISSATSILHVGATPVWAEVQPDSYNVDPADVERLITDRTRAVLAVHYAGQPADLTELSAICTRHSIHLLEDAAEAHGATYQGRSVGGWGTAGMFSFTPTKNITTGEGGVITTHDPELAARLRLMRNHGQSALYCHDSLGYNWRMTEMQAAIGTVQVGRLDSVLAAKRERAEWMTDRLERIPGVFPPAVRPGRDHAYMLYTLRVEGDRRRYLEEFAAAGIEARVYFPPAHRQRVFGCDVASLPVTETLAAQILSIPMHAGLGHEDLAEIADLIQEVGGRVAKDAPPPTFVD